MAFGHTSRTPRAVVAGNQKLRGVVRAGDYRGLHCDYGFRFLLADDGLELDAPSAIVDLWEEGRRGRIFDLEARYGAECARARGAEEEAGSPPTAARIDRGGEPRAR